jgi:hypothetical protein
MKERAMRYKVKITTVIGSCIVFSLWWFGVNNQSIDERVYPKEEYSEDLSRVYYDLGKSAQRRNDWSAAIRHYTTALNFKPDLTAAHNSLCTCQKQFLSLASNTTTNKLIRRA